MDTQGNPLIQPRTFTERVNQARSMIEQSKTASLKPPLPGVPPTVAPVTTPVLIDEMDNRVWCTYGYMPNCAYLIGKKDGEARIIFRENWQSADPKTDLWPNMEQAINDFFFP